MYIYYEILVVGDVVTVVVIELSIILESLRKLKQSIVSSCELDTNLKFIEL